MWACTHINNGVRLLTLSDPSLHSGAEDAHLLLLHSEASTCSLSAGVKVLLLFFFFKPSKSLLIMWMEKYTFCCTVERKRQTVVVLALFPSWIHSPSKLWWMSIKTSDLHHQLCLSHVSAESWNIFFFYGTSNRIVLFVRVVRRMDQVSDNVVRKTQLPVCLQTSAAPLSCVKHELRWWHNRKLQDVSITCRQVRSCV